MHKHNLRSVVAWGLAAAVLLAAGTSFAQQPEPHKVSQSREQGPISSDPRPELETTSEDQAAPAQIVKPITEYDYDEDKITGDFQKPGVLTVVGEGSRKPSSLLSPRTSFVPELIKSVEDL